MSLTAKRRTTEKTLARSQRNGRKSRGPVTSAGKAKSAAAKLIHGFYSQTRDEAMIALGEDPKKYAALLRTLVEDLRPRPGLETAVVGQMGRARWRMERAECIQDGLAVKRMRKGLQMEQMLAAPRMMEIHGIYEPLCVIARMLNRDDSTPQPGEIEAQVKGFGATPPDEVRKLFPLLRSYGEAAAKAPGPTRLNGHPIPTPSTPEWQEREAARQKLAAALEEVIRPYGTQEYLLQEEFDKMESPENLAALMAPRDENALLMQRAEDSSLRRLWRLTRIFLMIKGQPEEAEVDESSR